MARYEPSFSFYSNDEYAVEHRHRIPDNEIRNRGIYMALSRVAQRGAVIFPVQLETSPVTRPTTRNSLGLIPMRMSLLDGDFRPTATIPHDGNIQDGIWELEVPVTVHQDRKIEPLTRGFFLHQMPDAIFAHQAENGFKA
jgi:hypothetical protein